MKTLVTSANFMAQAVLELKSLFLKMGKWVGNGIFHFDF